MKILIVIAAIIVFISVFFILFTFDTAINRYIECSKTGVYCSESEVGASLVFGLTIVVSFMLVSILAVYIVIKTVMSDVESGGY